ncbi:jerky protein homolog-like [Anastrepha ludens]|uniref:jerky protein homolog-like n=1 Tax=Anastrepha ludens TaxID=28586 RepID=UPI0023B12A36|nr:jerky protein homolog-like [Anastrepha ludens]
MKKNKIFDCVNNTLSGQRKRKTLRASELPKMEKRLYQWFVKQREKHYPVNALALKQKAKEIHLKIKEKECYFNASDGWLQGFKKRYGVRLLKITGEKLSSQPLLVEPFKIKLKQKIEEMGLCHDQLYNADESGLFWKILPEKSEKKKTAPGVKTEKQRVTFLCCANASGNHKLRLLVIGKAKNPRIFKNFNCPTEYKSSKSSSMTSAIFYDWFHKSFVPQVTDFLLKKTIKPNEAVEIFNRALDWAQCEIVEQNDLNVLRRLREKALLQVLERKKQQKKITDFF